IYTVWASTYNNLGIARSAGCIRLTTEDSKWIYDHCAVGTVVEVYESPIVGPFNRPTIDYEIPFEQRWDPTDPNVTPEGIAASRQAILAAHGIQ
ncbi:MAG: L,D-transpeptidase, partial [Bacillota bacterium]|nr:L,D-transpeptidase [Bacillota bacterium]